MAEVIEQLTDELEEDTQKGKFMTFRSGNEFFGIELKYIVEIIGIQPITAVPEVEEYIKGLINLRGKIIPVIDVRVRFKQEPHEYNDRTCIIIINVSGTVVGLIVEKIAGVVNIKDDDIEPPPSLSSENGKNKYVYGLGKVEDGVKLLLDPHKLIKYEDLTVVIDSDEETVQEDV
ncbi:MAG: purine-binding chemotaxis protein CheW [Lachnospira sp.]|nr:purine-binding chemotaxis protein CheW [Lachnospira sp.]